MERTLEQKHQQMEKMRELRHEPLQRTRGGGSANGELANTKSANGNLVENYH
jgi:hypothetical protein